MITTKANAQGEILMNSLHTSVTETKFLSAGTLGFYLNGVAYPNRSTVLRSDIGEGANVLQCTMH